MDSSAVRAQVTKRMPALIDELRALVAIPSVAFPGFPPEPVGRMAAAVVDLLHRSGSRDAGLLDIPGGYPAVYGTIPGPPGAPRVLLYAHYDVQPAPLDQGWDTDPWQPSTGEDGRIYGRGAADDKSGVIIHAGALQVLRGALPVGVTVLVEGEEETISHLEDFVEANPELFDCDAFVIADMGHAGGRSTGPDHRPARRGLVHRDGQHPRPRGALRRVRRRRPGRTRRADPHPRDAARRPGQHRRRRPGRVRLAGCRPGRAGVPRDGRGAGRRAAVRHRVPRLAALVEAVGDGDRPGRAAGGRGVQRAHPAGDGQGVAAHRARTRTPTPSWSCSRTTSERRPRGVRTSR